MSATPYRFSLGPWNIGRGADPFGPPVRPAASFDDVLAAAVDVAAALGTDLLVLWPAREGTAVRESKDPIRASGQLLEAIDAASGGFVGFDVKAQRTQAAETATAHLATSTAVFLRLVEKVRSFPDKIAAECIAARDYEALERTVLEHLLGC